MRLPPTPCRVCFRPCVFKKFAAAAPPITATNYAAAALAAAANPHPPSA